MQPAPSRPSVFAPFVRLVSAPTPGTAYVLLTIGMLCWAGNFVIGRWVAPLVPPLTLAALRWTGASLLLLPIAWPHLKRDAGLIRERMPILLFLGLMGSGIFNTIQYVALQSTTATSAAIINSSGPVMIALASFLLTAQRLTGAQAIGITISLTGVIAILSKGDLSGLAGLGQNKGDLLMVVAVAGWAIYTALLPRRPQVHALSFAALTYIFAALLNIPLAIGEHFLGRAPVWSAPAIGAVLYTAIFPSLIAYLGYARGVEIIGATRAGAFMHLIPLFAGVIAFVALGEQPHLYHAAGFALILAGVVLAARK